MSAELAQLEDQGIPNPPQVLIDHSPSTQTEHEILPRFIVEAPVGIALQIF